MPRRAGTVITPTTEVTTETHFMASAILLTPYLSSAVGNICHRVLSEPYPHRQYGVNIVLMLAVSTNPFGADFVAALTHLPPPLIAITPDRITSP